MKKHSVVHFELPSDDSERVKKFYSEAFGWDMIQYGPEMGNYIMAHTAETGENGMVKQPGAINGGIFPREETNNYTNLVIEVDDVVAHIEIVKNAGGKITTEPMDIPGIGKYVGFEDSEGNKLAMLQPPSME